MKLKTSTKNPKLGFISFLAAAIIFGLFGLLIRSLEEELNATEQITLRSLVALLVAGIWVLFSVNRSEFSSFKKLKVWGFALVFPTSVIIWTLAVIYGTVRSATFGLYFGSLATSALLGRFLYLEKLTKYDYLSLTLALLATVIFSLPFSEFNLMSTSLLLGIFAGAIQSFNLCYRRVLGDISPPIVVLAQSAGSLFVSSIISFSFSTSIPKITFPTLLLALIFGVLVVLVSYLMLVGAKNLEIVKGSIILSSELLWATLFAAMFLEEIPTMMQLAGCIVLLSALFLQTAMKSHKNQVESLA